MSNVNVLVIAAHPDDEVLGCGATIAKHVAAGDKVNVVIMAEGSTSRSETRAQADKGEVHKLRQAAEQANRILGTTALVFKDFPDNRMDSLDRLDVIKVVESLIGQFNPAILYTHHSGDVNIDHRIIHEAVVTACRPISGCPVETLLFFETVSSTEWQAQPGIVFHPNWFVGIADFLDKKLEALAAYNSEMRAWPHPRSLEGVEHLARWRGATAGVHAAEAFMLGRRVK